MTDPKLHARPKYEFILKCPAELYGKGNVTHQCRKSHNHKQPHECSCGRQWAPATGSLVPVERREGP